MWKRILFLVTALVLFAPSSHLAAQTLTWGSDQLIEDNVLCTAFCSQVAISGDKVVAVWSQYDGTTTNRIYSNYSTDGGATWGSDQLIEDNVGSLGSDPQVAISGDKVVAVWGQGNDIYSNYSTDGGENWHDDQLIEDNAGAAFNPQVAISGDKVVAVWEQQVGADTRIYSNYSIDGGENWGSDQLIEDNVTFDGAYPQVAISGDKVVAVWEQVVGGFFRNHSNYSTDGGENWHDDQLIEDNAVFTVTEPQVAISGDKVVSVWEQNNHIYSNYSTDGGENWGSDSEGDWGTNPQVAISGDKVVVVWDLGGRIYSNYSTDGGATWGTYQLIEDNVGFTGANPQVVISGDKVVAVWEQYDVGGDTRIYSNDSTDGGITWDPSLNQLIEDNVTFDGTCPQVAISGNKVVAVWEQSDGFNKRIYSNYSSFPAGDGDAGHSWSSSPCFIASAAYSSSTDDHPIPSPSASYGAGGLKLQMSTDVPVNALRNFRDEYLLTNKPGRTLVSAYERISPPIANFIRDKEPLKAIVRAGLKPLVWVADKVTH